VLKFISVSIIVVSLVFSLLGCSKLTHRKKYVSYSSKSRELANMLVKKGSNASLAEQLAAVKFNGYLIRNIKNPSREVQLAAVKEDGSAIKYIKNPSKEVQLAAVKEDGSAIKYIKNPSKEAQIAYVKQGVDRIKNIKNPSKEVQLAAVKQDAKAIKYIKNPSMEVQFFVNKKGACEKPNFTISDKNIELFVKNGKLKMLNKTKEFVKILSLAEYQDENIYKISPFKLAPESILDVFTTHDKLELNKYKNKIIFGYAIEYQVGNAKPRSIYKTKKYSISEL